MTTKALVVEDDPQVMDTIEDTLFSLGHEHNWVTNQQDARAALGRDHFHYFHYVLLDLQIPAKPNRGGASCEFGVNLLREISERAESNGLPVIIMTAYISECLDMSTRLLSFGASEFIAKPFANKERSLAKVIHKVLRGKTPRRPRKTSAGSALQPFTGGRLVFYSSHAELLAVKIITARGRSRSLLVLQHLAQRDRQGRFVFMSGEELADAIGAMGGVGTVTAAIQTLRRNITSRLRKIGIECSHDDVIAHDEQGYFLRDCIEVHDAADENLRQQSARPDATPSPNNRQRWVLEQLRCGCRLQRIDLEREFGIAQKTAKRDLAELVSSGEIEFVREGRGGFYEAR